MAGLNFHPAPGNISKLPPGWFAVRRNSGMGDIVATAGFAVPDNSMSPSVAYTMGVGDILATQGYTVPDRNMNPLADYVSGNRAMPGGKSGGGCGCAGGCGGKATLNGIGGVGDLAADFAAIQNDFTTANYSAILSAPIMGIPYAIPLALAAVLILPGLMGGGGGGRRRR
jgi:hypothetical protein